MGLIGHYIGKVSRVQKKLVGPAVFLKLVRHLVFSDPAFAENCVLQSNLTLCCRLASQLDSGPGSPNNELGMVSGGVETHLVGAKRTDQRHTQNF